MSLATPIPSPGTTPIQRRFSELGEQGRCALMPFVMAGDPDLATTAATAGEWNGILRGLTAPVRALHREKPATCQDDHVERLAAEIDWLEHHIDAHPAHHGERVGETLADRSA